MNGLVIDVRPHIPGQTVVSLEGALDTHTSQQLREVVTGLIESGCSQLILDMSAVQYVDSSGLGVMTGIGKQMRQIGGSVSVIAPARAVRRILELTNLGGLFHIQ